MLFLLEALKNIVGNYDWAISNPSFLPQGDLVFLKFIHLKHTGIISHAGDSFDGRIALDPNGGQGAFMGIGKDHLTVEPKITVVLTNGKTFEQKVSDTH